MNIPIKKDGYDPFIDYLKGVSILFVVLAHCLPKQEYLLFSLWGAQAVPLFLLIQVFHAYKKGIDHVRLFFNLKKLFHRILKPFIFLLTIEVGVLLLYGHDLVSVVKDAIIAGGIGPGSYYVWIYIQFFFLLPIVAVIIRRLNRFWCFFGFTLLCVMVEIICSYVHPHPAIYRLLFIRYIYLIYLGYLWVSWGIVINKLTVFLSILSIAFILLFVYGDLNLEPLFYSNAWALCHWITYFYTAYLFIYLLFFIYSLLGKHLKSFCYELGRYSYEIFLLQMFVFAFFPSLDFIGNKYVEVLLRIVLTTLLSIFPVLLYKKYVAIKQ